MTTSSRRPSRARREAGVGLPELLVTVGIVAVVTAVSIPVFYTYLRSSTLRAGAEEFVTVVNMARSLAIKDNLRACVAFDPASKRVRLLVASGNPCTAGASAYGRAGHGFDSRVDADGWITLQNGVVVTAATAEVVFTSLGFATPGGTYTIAKDGHALDVVVAPSGRVSVTP